MKTIELSKNRGRTGTSAILITAVMVVSTAWMAQLIFRNITFNGMYGQLGDEAILVQGAERILDGQVPHRDFYSWTGGGTYYPLALAFRVFGDGLAVVRGLNLLNAAAISLALLWLCWPLIGRASTIVTLYFAFAVYPSWPLLSHHWMILLLAIVATGLVNRRRSYGTLALAGVFTMLGASMMYNKAFALFAALAGLVLYSTWHQQHRWRWIGAYLAGAVLTGLGLIALAVLQGAWPDFIRQVVVNNIFYYPRAAPALFLQPNAIFFILIITVVALCIPLLRSSWLDHKHRPTYLSLAIVNACLSVSIIYFLGPIHLAQVVMFSIPLYIYIFQLLYKRIQHSLWGPLPFRLTPFVMAVALGSMALYISSLFVSDGYQYYDIAHPSIRLGTSKGKFLVLPAVGRTMTDEVGLALKLSTTTFQTSRVMWLPYRPGYYYLTGRANPTSFDHIPLNNLSDQDLMKLQRDLQRVDAVVYIPASWPGIPMTGNVMTAITSAFPRQKSFLDGGLQVFSREAL